MIYQNKNIWSWKRINGISNGPIWNEIIWIQAVYQRHFTKGLPWAWHLQQELTIVHTVAEPFPCSEHWAFHTQALLDYLTCKQPGNDRFQKRHQHFENDLNLKWAILIKLSALLFPLFYIFLQTHLWTISLKTWMIYTILQLCHLLQCQL